MSDVVTLPPLGDQPSNTKTLVSGFTVGQGVGAFDLHLSRGWINVGSNYYGRGPGLQIMQKATGITCWGPVFGRTLASALNAGGVNPLELRGGVWAARYSQNERDWSEWIYHANDFASLEDAGQVLLTGLDPTATYWLEAFCMMPPDALNATTQLERHRMPADGGTGNTEHLGLVELVGIVHNTGATFLDYTGSIRAPFRVHVYGDSNSDGFPQVLSLTQAEREGIRTVLRRTPSASFVTLTTGVATLSKLIREGSKIEWWFTLLDTFCRTYGMRLEVVNLSVAGRWQGGIMGASMRAFWEGTYFSGLWEDFAGDGWKHITNGGGASGESDMTAGTHWTGGIDDPHLILLASFANDARIQAPIERAAFPGDNVFSSSLAGTPDYRDDLNALIGKLRTEWPAVRILAVSDHLTEPTGGTVLEQIRKVFGKGEGGSPPFYGFSDPAQSDYSWGRYVEPVTDFDAETQAIIQRGLEGVGTIDGDSGELIHFSEDQHEAERAALQGTMTDLNIGSVTFSFDFSVPGNSFYL